MKIKITEWTVRLLCVAAVVSCAVCFLSPACGIRADIVFSGSMEPALRTGSIAFTNIRKTEPEPGDIITYCLEDACITHRVVEKGRGFYITKGDANDAADAVPVVSSQIIGTVVFSIPMAGYAAVLFRQKSVFCIILLMLVQESVLYIIRWKGERCENARKTG